MKKYETKNLRNIGLIGHSRSGKTSLAESLLFCSETSTRLGSVDDGNSTFDYEPEEIKRTISLNSSLGFCEWDKVKITIIDTPGDANFSSDTRSCMQAMDTAIMVINAVSGVEVITERVWQYAEELNVPIIAFINLLDRERSDFSGSVQALKDTLQANPLVLQLPIGSEENLRGVVDLITMKAFITPQGGSGKPSKEEIPQDMLDEAGSAKESMIETIAEADDTLLEKYLEEGELTEDEILTGLKNGIQQRKFLPILAGSATRLIGIHPLLDLIAQSLPSPLDRESITGLDPKSQESSQRDPSPDQPFSALVFKTNVDPFTGKINIFRIFSGEMSADSTIFNPTKDAKERIGQILQIQGKKQEGIGSATTGDIVAVAKLKVTSTGDTLCDNRQPILYKSIPSLPSVISYAIQPKSKGDEDKIGTSLARLKEEDPTVELHRDAQTREFILSGTGQIHLEVIVERLKRKFGVEVKMQTPKVPYKEAIKGKSTAQGKYKRQSGGRGQYGDTWMELEPLPKGEDFEFVNKIVGGAIPRQYIPAVEKGVKETMVKGVLAGYPVSGIRVTLYDGSFHSVDSSEMAFKIAASMGFKKAFMDATPILLEPVMNMEIAVPDENMGDIIGDLNSRRGKVLGVEAKGNAQTIRAQAPLSEILQYDPDLRSITGGKGAFSMSFSHNEEVPAHLSKKVIEATKKDEEEE